MPTFEGVAFGLQIETIKYGQCVALVANNIVDHQLKLKFRVFVGFLLQRLLYDAGCRF